MLYQHHSLVPSSDWLIRAKEYLNTHTWFWRIRKRKSPSVHWKTAIKYRSINQSLSFLASDFFLIFFIAEYNGKLLLLHVCASYTFFFSVSVSLARSHTYDGKSIVCWEDILCRFFTRHCQRKRISHTNSERIIDFSANWWTSSETSQTQFQSVYPHESTSSSGVTFCSLRCQSDGSRVWSVGQTRGSTNVFVCNRVSYLDIFQSFHRYLMFRNDFHHVNSLWISCQLGRTPMIPMRSTRRTTREMFSNLSTRWADLGSHSVADERQRHMDSVETEWKRDDADGLLLRLRPQRWDLDASTRIGDDRLKIDSGVYWPRRRRSPRSRPFPDWSLAKHWSVGWSERQLPYQ